MLLMVGLVSGGAIIAGAMTGVGRRGIYVAWAIIWAVVAAFGFILTSQGLPRTPLSETELRGTMFLLDYGPGAVVLCAVLAVASAIGAAAYSAPKEAVQPTRACPFCAETILAAAAVCKHCGRDIPTAPTV